MQELGCAHSPEEWRCCVDSSKFILKVVLLHKGNIHPSVPIAHFIHMKESYKYILALESCKLLNR
jgi:hypothetical protein